MEYKMKIKSGSIIGYGLALTGLLLLIDKNYIISENPVSTAIQILSVLLMVWARLTFGRRSFHLTANTTEGKLVTNGPYQWLRHPIYASVIYFSWSCFIPFPHLWTLAAAFLVTTGLFIRMILEEKSLMATYPEYKSYTRKAKRIIPYVF
jgi:protein-S-isoprenylcysteine O-methyltransferase Ste14